MSSFEKFIPYCLSLVLYVHYRFSMIFAEFESPKPRPFKPDRPRTFANSLCRMKKKNTFILRASGSQFTCAPHNIYHPLSFQPNKKVIKIALKTKSICTHTHINTHRHTYIHTHTYTHAHTHYCLYVTVI